MTRTNWKILAYLVAAVAAVGATFLLLRWGQPAGMATSILRPPHAAPHADGALRTALLQILIILAVARLFGALARRLGQPAVIGEIVAGITLGPR